MSLTRRVGRLEEKLNNIETLLRSSQPHLQVPEGSRQHESSLSPSLPTELRSTSSINSIASNSASQLFPPYLPSPTGQAEDHLISPSLQLWQSGSLPSFNLSYEEADDMLHVYQTQMTEHFPFVIVPAGTRTQDLRADKPFLYAAIILAASRQKLPRQTLAGSRLMEYLSIRMLLNGEKNLDLLQGILVYIAWCGPCLIEYQCTTRG